MFDAFAKTPREYHFINLNGEEDSYIIREEDHLSQRKCEIDGANLVMIDGGRKYTAHCPCCGGPQFSLNNLDTLGQIENYIKGKYAEYLGRKIEYVKQKLSKLEKPSEIVKNRDSPILKKNKENSYYNKANLSEQQDVGQTNQDLSLLKIMNFIHKILKNHKKPLKTLYF